MNVCCYRNDDNGFRASKKERKQEIKHKNVKKTFSLVAARRSRDLQDFVKRDKLCLGCVCVCLLFF